MAKTVASLVLASVALGACATAAPPRWERPGVGDQSSAWDASDCGAISWTEAERLHPYEPTQQTGTLTVDSDWMRQRQRVDNERFADANRFFALCMQNRGYTKVEPPRR